MASVKKSKKELLSSAPIESEEPAGLVKLIQRLNQKKEPENSVEHSPESTQPEPEKMYRVFNHSDQTIYVINADGTHCLLPRAHLDIPETKISEHIKLMARRGAIRLFSHSEEKKKEQ